MHEPLLQFCVAHSVLDQEQESVLEHAKSNTDEITPPTFPMHDVQILVINFVECEDSNVL